MALQDPTSEPITTVLLKRAESLGAQVRTSTAARRIVTNQGSVSGLEILAADGSVEQLSTRAVVIATGGFSGNPELVEKYTGYKLGVDAFPFELPAMIGDGMRMARELGAASTPMMIDTYVCLPPPFHGPGGTTFELGSFRQPNLMVNVHGQRFMNEEVMQNPGFAANAVHRQLGGYAYMLVDADIEARYEREGWDYVMSKVPATGPDGTAKRIAAARAEHYPHLFAADSITALAAQMGVDATNLEGTVAQYNAACAAGRDEEFFKPAINLRPLRKPPFLAARFFVGGYGTLGGIRINPDAQVLDAHERPIPGLYAAGNDANALFGGTYPFALAGNASSFCFNTARIAAEAVRRYIR